MINKIAIICQRKAAKINCKKRYRFKQATLYEREFIRKQNFFIRWQKLPYLRMAASILKNGRTLSIL
jgi:hypothetical protein